MSKLADHIAWIADGEYNPVTKFVQLKSSVSFLTLVKTKVLNRHIHSHGGYYRIVPLRT